jgi:hypothetical protein
MNEPMKKLRAGLLNSPLTETVEVEVGGARTELAAIFLEPTSPLEIIPVTRLAPAMQFDAAALADTRAKPSDVIIRGATLYDPGTRYVITDIPPPDVAGMTRVALRLQQ